MTTKRWLSKSRFKVGYECPAKLYFNEQPKIYGNKNRENEFLKALAQGGFQVGALAKVYFPGGIDLEGLNADEAVAKTNELLRLPEVTIFEAAIQTGSFLVRVDVLVKKETEVSVIEVKSSSIHSKSHKDFFKKRDPGIDGDWEPYLVDVAFQTWVTRQAHPEWTIQPFLMLADKSTVASVEGLHQFFRLQKTSGYGAQVSVKPGITKDSVGQPVLAQIPVLREVEYLINQEVFPTGEHLPSFANYLADCHLKSIPGISRVSSLCKSCEFRIGDEMKLRGLKSGFEECWTRDKKIREEDKDRALIFDIWNCRKTPELLSKNKVFFDQLTEEDLKPKTKSKKIKKLLPYQRQWIQIQKRLSGDQTPFVDREGLKDLLDSVAFPIHCIDFETSMVAIPFHKGRRPYEQLAFQFSHHVLSKDGTVAHVDQYIDTRSGAFPNFDFVRKLKDSLSGDKGTIFRYATHENTVLRQIREQLEESSESDRDVLMKFIDEITQPRDGEDGDPGHRNMIDLREVVLQHFYHPLMGGSNSIKKVIPAVLEESKFLKEKYSGTVYGKRAAIKSMNFDQMAWIEIDSNGKVVDPYKKLPPVFLDIPQSWFDEEAPLFHDDSIDDGGAAMTAWSRMQFTEMSEVERKAIEAALLKYCELDTLSMIWLIEYWFDQIATD